LDQRWRRVARKVERFRYTTDHSTISHLLPHNELLTRTARTPARGGRDPKDFDFGSSPNLTDRDIG
jgi:hypothetical protein